MMPPPLRLLGGCTISKQHAFSISRPGLLHIGVACIFLLGVPRVWADTKMPVIQFSIKPRMCVLTQGERVCEDELEIKWQAEQLRSLCLFRKDKTLPLRCWEDAHTGEHYIKISASRNVDFQLKELRGEQLLVTEAFEVVQDNPQFRKRRRNAWSFF